jgi:hypothetical protein
MYDFGLRNKRSASAKKTPVYSFGRRQHSGNTKMQGATAVQIGRPINTIPHPKFAAEVDDTPKEIIEASETILTFFIAQSKNVSTNTFLKSFEDYFIYHDSENTPSELHRATYHLLVSGRTSESIHLLNRCAFLFVNSCLKSKQTQYIDQLIQLFENAKALPNHASLATQKFRDWLNGYMMSRQYQLLRVFSPQSSSVSSSWGDRYICFSLMAQTFDPETPIEQRQASQMLYQFLKHRYKFQLVMYLTKGCDAAPNEEPVLNPTKINATTLKLIQKLVLKKGKSYQTMADDFLAETSKATYGEFKNQLSAHLLLAITGDRRLKWLPEKISKFLVTRYSSKNQIAVGHHLITKTCDELIAYLLDPENLKDPTHPFTLLMIEQEFLSLSILLLKLVLISPRSYGQLMRSLNELIRHFSPKPQAECEWLMSFLETMQVILTLAVQESQYYSLASAA